MRRVALETGEVLESRDIPADQFGEGLALLDGQFTSLTWTSGVAHRWSASGLKPQGNAPYPYEGWGLTAMDGALVASDGSATLRFLDPQTFALLREITVTINGSPIRRINELEMVDGLIYANVWFTGFILGIDPQTGAPRRGFAPAG